MQNPAGCWRACSGEAAGGRPQPRPQATVANVEAIDVGRLRRKSEPQALRNQQVSLVYQAGAQGDRSTPARRRLATLESGLPKEFRSSGILKGQQRRIQTAVCVYLSIREESSP